MRNVMWICSASRYPPGHIVLLVKDVLGLSEVGTWFPATAALLAYSATHALTVGKAVSLILAGSGHEGLAVQGGMAVVAMLASALVYDNAILASGKFLGQVIHICQIWFSMR